MPRIQVDPRTLSVGIGFPCGPDVPFQTAQSLAATTAMLAGNGIPGQLHVIAGASLATVARNRVLQKFLEGDASRLFWIDSDMAWREQDFLKLLILSSVYDVVCATYPLKNMSGTLVIHTPDPSALRPNEHGLLEILGTGLGFTVVTRAAVERLVATKPVVQDVVNAREIPDVFSLDRVVVDGVRQGMGEDMRFFRDLIDLGYKVMLDPTIVLGHVGSHEYRVDPVQALGLEDVYGVRP